MNKRFTPNFVKYPLPSENHIFVFGSNLAGRHGKGAAKYAKDYFGAKYGKGFGLQGQSYAIPTKDRKLDILSLDEIFDYVDYFNNFVKKQSQLIFYITEIGCGLAGYTPKEIAPLFWGIVFLDNVYFPERFWNVFDFM